MPGRFNAGYVGEETCFPLLQKRDLQFVAGARRGSRQTTGWPAVARVYDGSYGGAVIKSKRTSGSGSFMSSAKRYERSAS